MFPKGKLLNFTLQLKIVDRNVEPEVKPINLKRTGFDYWHISYEYATFG